MQNKIPKLAITTAGIHLILSLGSFISVAIYSLFGANKEGAYPVFLLIMTMAISIADYPIAFVLENWAFSKPWPGYITATCLIVFGTIFWFIIGFLLNAIITRLKRIN
jgi:hypothetical protein